MYIGVTEIRLYLQKLLKFLFLSQGLSRIEVGHMFRITHEGLEIQRVTRVCIIKYVRFVSIFLPLDYLNLLTHFKDLADRYLRI